MSGFSEAQFAGWMATWAEAIAAAPGWRELTHYRDVSALDTGYMHLYFRVLDQVRPMPDLGECATVTDRKPKEGGGLERFGRIGRRLHSRELTVGEGVRRALHQAVERSRMALPPASLPTLGPERTALVVRAAPNATAFPVLEALRDELGWRCAFASWSRTVEPRVHALGIPYFHLADTYRRRYVGLCRQHGKAVASALARLDTRDLQSAFVAIAGIPIAADLSSLLGEVMREICCETRVQADLYFDLFSRTSPAVLILFNEVSLRERPAARVAAQIGLKSVTLQHGLYIGHVYRSLATDKVIVWGQIPRQFWLDRGCAADRVISVGAYGHERWSASRMIRQVGSAAAEAPTVLFLGQNPAAFLSPALHRDSIDVVVDAARRLPGVQISIRPHPGESPVPYETAVRSSGLANVAIQKGRDLPEALRHADAVLTVFSTAGLEAMLSGVPVIVLNPSAEPPLAPYASAVPTVESAIGLVRVIERLTRDAAYRAQLIAAGGRYAGDYFGSLEGAASRAAVHINQYAGTGHAEPTGSARLPSVPTT